MLRSLDFPTREALLEGRTYAERAIEVPGPSGPIATSVFEPRDRVAPAPALVWIHGGGLVAGDRFGAVEALEAASAIGAVVVSPEYRLAPEHPAPAPGDDCEAVVRWIAANASALGLDSHAIVLGGASAGGGLAAATALRLRDRGGPAPHGLLLCCPMLDDRTGAEGHHELADLGPWTLASNRFGWRSLLGDRAGTDDVSVYEAPGRATDLSGLPPTYVDVGSADLFRDEDVAFAGRIWAGGGDAELHVWPGGYHGFELLVPTAALSGDTVAARRRWLARVAARALATRP